MMKLMIYNFVLLGGYNENDADDFCIGLNSFGVTEFLESDCSFRETLLIV